MRVSQLPRDTERTSIQKKRGTKTQSAKRRTEARKEGPRVDTLQQELGNRAVQELLETGRVQSKQGIGFASESTEREANRVRQQVMGSADAQLQRSCPNRGGCQTRERSQTPEHHKQVDRRRDASRRDPTRAVRDREVNRSRELRASQPGKAQQPMGRSDGSSGTGRPLDDAVLEPMEAFFDRDLSNVRIHTDRRAATSAEAMNANAYTIGHEIFFGKGQYTPETNTGLGLLAHELTHVVQQSRGRERLQFDRDNENEAGSLVRSFIERAFTVYWTGISPLERYLLIQNELDAFQRIDPVTRLVAYMDWCAEVHGVRETEEGRVVDTCLHCETTEDFWGRDKEECHYPYDRGAPFFFRDEGELRTAEDKARKRWEERRRHTGIPQEEFIRRGRQRRAEWHLGLIQNQIMGFTRAVGPAVSVVSSVYDAYDCVHHDDEESCAKAGQSFLINFAKGMLKR